MLLGCRTVAVLTSAALFSCGGSSSETPPPLEPHPLNLHYSRSATALASDNEPLTAADAGVAAADQPRDVDEREDVPARRTWGSDPPPPRELK
jgi:hypothetical protein